MPSVNCSPFGPKPQIELAAGTPAVGYKLFFYVAGSVNTKQNTYTDSTGTVANANPLILNTLGQPSTEVWFTAGQAYKVVLAPSTDTDPPTSPVWSVDNLRGINDTSVTIDQWVSGPAPTYISGTQFSLVGDQTSIFQVGRRVKATVTAGTVYGTISNSVFGAVTTVTVVNDSGALDSGLSAVSYGLLTPLGPSIPQVSVTSFTLPTERLAGRTTAATGAVEAITVAGALTFASQTLTAPYASRLINGYFQVDQRVNSATARTDDTYCLDRWYVLTQTASINVTQQTDQENGTPYNVRLTQSQASAQRMGLAQIIEAGSCKDLRAQAVALAARVRISNSQALRYAILEWTGTADSVTSDVVLDWTSATYTAGNFFLAANLTVTAVGSMTPSANTWTDLTELTGTLGSSVNNLIVFVWTEGTAAQNVTLDIARARCGQGAVAPVAQMPDYADTLARAQRYYCKTFPMATAPAQAAGRSGDWEFVGVGAATGSLAAYEFAWPVRMRTSPSVTTYNPISANANARDFTNAADRTPTTLDTSDRRISVTFATLANAQMGLHLAADAEL